MKQKTMYDFFFVKKVGFRIFRFRTFFTPFKNEKSRVHCTSLSDTTLLNKINEHIMFCNGNKYEILMQFDSTFCIF
jgi:GH15 family glucan-1,4-alpha-glucosidase